MYVQDTADDHDEGDEKPEVSLGVRAGTLDVG